MIGASFCSGHISLVNMHVLFIIYMRQAAGGLEISVPGLCC